MDMNRLWDITPGKGEGSRIALLDTGVDVSHPDFRNSDIICGDMINPGDRGWDIDGHGTACAGIILAIAPRCTLLSARIMDRGGSFTYDCLISGLYWAGIRKADVICICSGARHSDLLVETRLAELEKEGCITLAATGNHGKHGAGAGVFPARSPACVAVGSATSAGELSHYTNVLQEKPVYCLPGEEFKAASLGGSYVLLSGTSASAAAMAGVLALSGGRDGVDRRNWNDALDSASLKKSSSRGDFRLVDPSKLLSQVV